MMKVATTSDASVTVGRRAGCYMAFRLTYGGESMAPPPYPGAPRWVRWLGVLAAALVLLFVVLHLTGNAPMSHG